MQIGRKIYYDKATGNIIVDTGERQGAVVPTTIDQDFQAYSALADRVRDAVEIIELEYGQFRQDFSESNGYRVNLETLALEFSYPDPNEEETQEPVYHKTLSEQINELEDKTDQAIMELTMILAMGGMA